MNFGRLDERRSKRFGMLLNSMFSNDIRNRQVEQDVNREQSQQEETRRELESYRMGISGRRRFYEEPIDMPHSQSRMPSIDGGRKLSIQPIVPTETRERTIYPSQEEEDRLYNETQLRLLQHGNNPYSSRASSEMGRLRRTTPKQDMSRTPYEDFSQGTPEQRKRAEEFTRLQGEQKQNLRQTYKVGVNPTTKKYEYFTDVFNPRTGQQEREWTGMEAPNSGEQARQTAKYKFELGITGGQGNINDYFTYDENHAPIAVSSKLVGKEKQRVRNNTEKSLQKVKEDKVDFIRQTDSYDRKGRDYQDVIDDFNNRIKYYSRHLDVLNETSTKVMTKSEFIEDFKNDEGREPDEKEIEVAKKRGLWE